MIGLGLPSPTGINVIGLVSGHHGLGVAARNIVSALLTRGFDVAVLDLDDGQGRKGFAGDFAGLTVDRPDDLPYLTSLFVLSPSMVAHDVVKRHDVVDLLTREGATNSVLTFWELMQLPKGWVRALEVFDAVVAPSPFVEGLLDSCLCGTQVVRGMLPVDIPDEIAAARARFGIPEAAFVMVSSFDPLSDPERKNPFGALEAFRRAFPGDENVRLIFKVNLPRRHLENSRLTEKVVRPLIARLEHDHRVQLITDTLAYRDVLSLYASADAFISLHRAEGLGLGLLESMALAKPVVATGWSGNKAFMTPSCSCLVNYSLVPVTATLPAYTTVMRGLAPTWAEPDLDDAAAWLRQLAANESLRVAVGAKAQAAFRRYQQTAARMEFVDDILAIRNHQLGDGARAHRRDILLKKISVAQRQLRRDSMGVTRWLAHLGREHFDRHVGWRLKGSRAEP